MKWTKKRGEREWASPEGYRIVELDGGLCPFVTYGPGDNSARWGLGAHSSLEGAKRTAQVDARRQD